MSELLQSSAQAAASNRVVRGSDRVVAVQIKQQIVGPAGPVENRLQVNSVDHAVVVDIAFQNFQWLSEARAGAERVTLRIGDRIGARPRENRLQTAERDGARSSTSRLSFPIR